MNKGNNGNQFEAMLKMTADKLGTTPDEIKRAAERGDISSIIENSGENTEQLKKVLSDPEKAKKMLSSPEVQEFMDRLNGK